MSYAELEKMKADIKINPDKYTVEQVKLMQYMSSSKFTTDWLDRHISRAPQDIEVGGDMKLEIVRTIIDNKE